MFHGFTNKLATLNFFFNRHKSSHVTLRTEQRATRLYLILLVSIFMVLLLYNSLVHETVRMSVEQPTETTYEYLERSFTSSLECPCTQISFTYNSFVRISAQMHQICSSEFIELAWIENIFENGNWSKLPMNEFRIRGAVFFLVQKTLCDMANRFVNNAVQRVLSKQIFRGKVIPKEQLLGQVKLDIADSKASSINDYFTLVRSGRGVTQCNQLMNMFSSNWIYSFEDSQNISQPRITTRPVSHGLSCSCATSATCIEPVFFGDRIVPGFFLGCHPIESLLRSNLICLYNQTCVNLINVAHRSSIHALDATWPSRFMLNSSVEELTMNAFTEQWLYDISYSDFFSTCRPMKCTHLVRERKNILQVVTILLGLYGGLTIILRQVGIGLVAAVSQISSVVWRHNGVVVPFA